MPIQAGLNSDNARVKFLSFLSRSYFSTKLNVSLRNNISAKHFIQIQCTVFQGSIVYHIIIMQSHYNTLIQNSIELTLIPGIGIRTQNRIYSAVSDISALFAMGDKSLRSIGIPESTIPAIRSRAYKQAAEEIVDWSVHEGCHILVRGAGKYPSLLQQIDNAPIVLYVLGALENLDRPHIAIVGSRRPTVYGLQTAQDIASELGSRGICVVSGLARGIDAAAHRRSLHELAPLLFKD